MLALRRLHLTMTIQFHSEETDMSDFFKWLGDWCPTILWGAIWISVLPMRLILLVLLPKNANDWHHPAHPLYQYLAFER